MLQRNKCFVIVAIIGRILSLVVVIYGIIALATSSPSFVEIILFGLYLIIESINIWVVILIALFIIFSPIICCVGCVYMCVYGSRAFVNRDTLTIPTTTKASAQVIENA